MSTGSAFPLFTPRSGGSGGGGGSIFLDFHEYGNAPIRETLSNYEVYTYESGLAQELYAYFKVPSTYSSGSQITLEILWFCSSSSGTGLIASQSTLIRSETDAYTSTTNQRTSTNSAVTLGAGTVNEPQKVTLDLTDASGQINSVGVSAGDLILVRVYRDTDTATGDIEFLYDAHEVVF